MLTRRNCGKTSEQSLLTARKTSQNAQSAPTKRCTGQLELNLRHWSQRAHPALTRSQDHPNAHKLTDHPLLDRLDPPLGIALDDPDSSRNTPSARSKTRLRLPRPDLPHRPATQRLRGHGPAANPADRTLCEVRPPGQTPTLRHSRSPLRRTRPHAEYDRKLSPRNQRKDPPLLPLRHPPLPGP